MSLRPQPTHTGGVNPALRHPTPIPMIRRIRPLRRMLHQSVLHRIDPAIQDMRAEIGFVPDMMLPEPLLPERRFIP